MSNREHPSLRFQRGEIKDFYTAMATYVAQYQFELDRTHELIRELPDPRHGFDANQLQEQTQGVQHIEEMVKVAKAIYALTVEAAIGYAARQMREKNDPYLRQIADALESGNYDQLAL